MLTRYNYGPVRSEGETRVAMIRAGPLGLATTSCESRAFVELKVSSGRDRSEMRITKEPEVLFRMEGGLSSPGRRTAPTTDADWGRSNVV